MYITQKSIENGNHGSLEFSEAGTDYHLLVSISNVYSYVYVINIYLLTYADDMVFITKITKM